MNEYPQQIEQITERYADQFQGIWIAETADGYVLRVQTEPNVFEQLTDPLPTLDAVDAVLEQWYE